MGNPAGCGGHPKRFRARGVPMLLGALAGAWFTGHFAAARPMAPFFSTTVRSNLLAPTSQALALPSTGVDCRSCHNFDAGMSHPVDIRPSMAIPGEFPLHDGNLTCITCHDASARHASHGEPVGVRTEESGAALCSQCHAGASPFAKSAHALATNRAHFASSSRAEHEGAPGGLDRESQNCMSCHDGAAGADAGTHQFRVGQSGPEGDHPIGVPMRVTERTRHGDFWLARRVDSRIRLFDGLIGCGTCHSVYAPGQAQLVISNHGSKLCLSCHVQ